LVTEATPQLSPVIGVPKTTLVAKHPVFVNAATLAGQVIVGNVSSTTVTICVHVPTLPEPSVAVHVTVVFPNG